MMKKVALYGSLLALVGATAAYAQGQFPGYPLATASPSSGNAVTYPLTGVEQIPADTMLSYGIQPQTEVIQTQQLKAYVLTAPTITSYLILPTSTLRRFRLAVQAPLVQLRWCRMARRMALARMVRL